VVRTRRKEYPNYINIFITVFFATWYLSAEWLPLGAHNSGLANFLLSQELRLILLALMSMVRYYEQILRWALGEQAQVPLHPCGDFAFGLLVWQGWIRSWGSSRAEQKSPGVENFRQTTFWQKCPALFPGAGKEFMPSLNEGSFLLMPTSMPHTGISHEP
jgi:copper/silver efflux system protein